MTSKSMVERFGNYEILRKLAQGGMAEVLLAKQQGLGGFERLVCLKRILPHLSSQEEFLKMFQDEARIVANLVHPNVAQIYDIGTYEGQYYIAMEYVRGEDLRRVYNQEVTRGRTIARHVAASIVMGAAAGLHYAHQHTALDGSSLGIVHRDVSPQNILVTFDGHVKLIDFGVAKAAGKLNHTRAGVLKGKYSYMSPEQASGDPVDARTDIFALGITLYEVTTGTRLFKRDNELETLHAVIACNVPRPSDVVPGYDADLEDIVLKALAFDAGSRYQTAGELERELEQYLQAHRHPTSASSLKDYMQGLFTARLADDVGSTPDIDEKDEVTQADEPAGAGQDAVKTGDTSAPPSMPVPASVDDEATTVDPQSLPPAAEAAPDAKPPARHHDTATPSEWHVVDDVAEQTGSTQAPRDELPAPFLPATEAAEVQRRANAAWGPGERIAPALTTRPKRFGARYLAIAAVLMLVLLATGVALRRQRAARRAAAQPTGNAVPVPVPVPKTEKAASAATATPTADQNGAAAQTKGREVPAVQQVTEARALPPGQAALDITAPLPMAVTLGGRYLGETPLYGLAVSPGNLHLKLTSRQEGLVIWRRVRLLRNRSHRVEVASDRGRLHIVASPWAWVQRGLYAATETPCDDALVPGEYLLTVECPDGRRRQQVVQVRAGVSANVNLNCQ